MHQELFLGADGAIAGVWWDGPKTRTRHGGMPPHLVGNAAGGPTSFTGTMPNGVFITRGPRALRKGFFQFQCRIRRPAPWGPGLRSEILENIICLVPDLEKKIPENTMLLVPDPEKKKIPENIIFMVLDPEKKKILDFCLVLDSARKR